MFSDNLLIFKKKKIKVGYIKNVSLVVSATTDPHVKHQRYESIPSQSIIT